MAGRPSWPIPTRSWWSRQHSQAVRRERLGAVQPERGLHERVDLAKKYPEKLAELKALFDQQAQEHHLYPLITWDDVLNSRIHRNKTASPSRWHHQRYAAFG